MLAAIKFIDPYLHSRPQRLEFGSVRSAAFFEEADTLAQDFACVLVLAVVHELVDQLRLTFCDDDIARGDGTLSTCDQNTAIGIICQSAFVGSGHLTDCGVRGDRYRRTKLPERKPHHMNIKVGLKAIEEASEKLSNWGKWGKDDHSGTLNYVKPHHIIEASKLIKKGKPFALGIPLDRTGPQTGLFGGRFNPIHQMLATGTDATTGQQDWNKIRYADDTIMLCVQGATHWDALGHIFYEDKAYNGHDAKLIDSRGLSVLGIEHSKDKMTGRGVLLDIARFKGVEYLEDGYGISNDELDACAKAQKVEIREADFVMIRTGQMEKCLKTGEWGGYAGGDAPGVRFENCYWCQDKKIAAIISDTWGVEVRPNETTEANQPWHWVVIPAMGLCMGEIFYLKELAEDCAKDKVYEFFFCGPPLIITGGTGSPLNPQAIK